jgi:hypothetical protein
MSCFILVDFVAIVVGFVCFWRVSLLEKLLVIIDLVLFSSRLRCATTRQVCVVRDAPACAPLRSGKPGPGCASVSVALRRDESTFI